MVSRVTGRSWRAVVAGTVGVGCLAALPWAAGSMLAAGLLTVGAVLAIGRSTLSWLGTSGPGRTARRLIRVGIFFAPVPFVASLDWSVAPLPALAGALVGLLLLAPDATNLRRSLDPAWLGQLPRPSGGDAGRDLIIAGGSGVAQEYLYRGVLLAGLVPLMGWWAVPAVAVLFVAEHLVQGAGGSSFDRRDVATQAGLSLALGALVLASGSIAPAVIGHTLYNLPYVAQTIVRVLIHRIDRSPFHAQSSEEA
jgi:hypothetical protein